MCSVNHDLKAIFIHIPKTGGLYVEETLIKNYGFIRDYSIKQNIITWSPIKNNKLNYNGEIRLYDPFYIDF